MKRLLAICLLLWMGLGIHTASAAEAVTHDELNYFKEWQQARLDAAKELQQKDTEALRQQVAAVDKRVDDQLAQVGQAVDRYGVASAWIGIVITVLLVGFGLMGIRNAKAEAKEAATEEAKKAAKEQADESARLWFEQHAKELKSRIAELEHKASQVHQHMDNTAQNVADHAEGIKKKQEQALETVQKMVRNPSSAPSPEQQEAQQVLKERAEELKNSGESSRSFDDWNTLAHAAYAAGKLEDAVYFWHKAAEVPHAGAVKVATVLVNPGLAQGQLNQSEAAITTYNEVVRRFGEASEPALRERVAKALVNKGITQGKLGHSEAEIATYDDVVRRFGEASEPALLEQVATALVNKGATQGQLGHSEAAIATYDDVVRRFGEASEPALRERVATALVNKGITQGQMNQSETAIATYDDVVRRFGEASEPALRERVASALNGRGFIRLIQAKVLGLRNALSAEHLQVALIDFNQAASKSTQRSGVVLGNLAYVQQLLGNALQAEANFAAALRAPVDGGQLLYETTLKDLDMHPIPEDQAMRELVERAWAAYQHEQGNGPKEPPATQPPH